MASYEAKEFNDALTPEEKKIHDKNKETLNNLGWMTVGTSEKFGIGLEHGYFGVCYARPSSSSELEIVFAHRGTCFNKKGNILADIAIAESKDPKILQDAFLYTSKIFGGANFYSETKENLELEQQRQVVEELRQQQRPTISKITHTGFSLGGFIAGVCPAINTSIIPNNAITFDSPGIGNFLRDRQRRGLPVNTEYSIINYVIEPNIVNTGCEHVGDIREIQFYKTHDTLPEEVNLHVNFSDVGFVGNPHFIDLLKTYDRHNLDKIIKSSNNGNNFSYRTVYRWPFAKNHIEYADFPAQRELVPSGNSAVQAIISVSEILIQAVAQGVGQFIWAITKNENNKGVISLNHKRENKVFYSEDEFLLSAQDPSLAAPQVLPRPAEEEPRSLPISPTGTGRALLPSGISSTAATTSTTTKSGTHLSPSLQQITQDPRLPAEEEPELPPTSLTGREFLPSGGVTRSPSTATSSTMTPSNVKPVQIKPKVSTITTGKSTRGRATAQKIT
jgi:hypothetical protein